LDPGRTVVTAEEKAKQPGQHVRVVRWNSGAGDSVVERFIDRQAFDPAAEETAKAILADIKKDGDKAVVRYVLEHDGVSLQPEKFAIQRQELAAARTAVDSSFKAAVREAHKRITAFARQGMRKDWNMLSPRGGELGEQFTPLDRVGVYIPGGSAPLASTVLMTVTLAKVAGVAEVVVCTPCGKDGKVNPHVLHALDVSGATEMYRVGGVQAIGMMAYGTQTVGKVQKIAGPGGTFVTAAKRQVYGTVALDLVAGPSEIAVLADETAEPACVACDLLSQAEHGTGWEKALLVSTSQRLVDAVVEELEKRAAELPRAEIVRRVMKNGMLLVVANTLAEGAELCNRFAPEHLEIIVREPRNWLKKVRAAGAVFVGPWSPESTGDFVAGPSHVLPTGGTAAMFSGLTVEDFRRRTSIISFTRADLQDTLPIIESFAKVEGLEAHALSARVRFEKK